MAKQLKLTDEFPKTKGSLFDEKKTPSKSVVIKEEIESLTAKPAKDVDTATEEGDLKLLKEFDLNSKYGPCVGITRLCRWERAKKFELDPPNLVHKILTQHVNDPLYQECLWRDEKGLVP